MEKLCIKREDLKHNFLKKIIIRADYRGVDETEIDKTLPLIKDYLKEQKYIKYRTEVAKEVDFLLEDPDTDNDIITKVNDVRKSIVHSFQNEEEGIYIKLSTSFVFVSIEMAKYKSCLTYCDELEQIIKYIKANSQFFELVRFGIRKINQCILLNVSKLNEYFEESFFHFHNFDETIKSKTFQSKECFFINSYDMNVICTIVCGETNDHKLAYQVTFDSDIYLQEERCSQLLSSFSKNVSEMNETLFTIYKEAITLNFLKLLQSETFENYDDISGVEKND